MIDFVHCFVNTTLHYYLNVNWHNECLAFVFKDGGTN